MRHLIFTTFLLVLPLCLSLPFALTQASPAIAGPSLQAGKALAEENCAACHGADGNSSDDPSFPKLSGQKPAYLAQQLRAFRSGARGSEVMGNFAKPLSDAQISDLAAYFASLKRAPEPAGMRAIGDARRGAQLWQARGAGSPPCARCHAPADFQRPGQGGGMGMGRAMGGGMGRGGMGGAGMGGGMRGPLGTDPATTPVLYAQHADYLLAQLNAFATGKRSDPVMDPIARGLSARDRADIAAYLASVR